MDILLQKLGLVKPPVREVILGIFKSKKKSNKKDSSSDTTTTDSCPVATADQIDAVYQSQLDNYSNTITGLNSNVTDLSTQLAEAIVNYKNEQENCAEELAEQKNNYVNQLSNQKNNYVNQLSNQKNDYINQLNTQKKTYESEITNLNNKLNSALKTITRDENTIKSDNETITMLREELRLAKMNRDKCIKEAIAAGKRFGFKNATVESNVYRAEIDGLFNDISQELETMKTQNLYVYVKRHIQHKKNLKTVDQEIDAYKNKVNINKRKSYYEQQEIDMEQGWEIDCYNICFNIHRDYCVFIYKWDKITNAPKIMNPKILHYYVFIIISYDHLSYY